MTTQEDRRMERCKMELSHWEEELRRWESEEHKSKIIRMIEKYKTLLGK